MTTDIEKLRGLLAKATPVKLHALGQYLGCRVNDRTIFHLDEIGQEYPRAPFQAIPFAKSADAKYLAAAWNALPALFAERIAINVKDHADELTDATGDFAGFEIADWRVAEMIEAATAHLKG